MTRKLAIFLVSTFVLTIVLAVGQQGMGISFETITIPQLAPALVVLVFFLFKKDLPAAVLPQWNRGVFRQIVLAMIIPLVLFWVCFQLASWQNPALSVTSDLSSLIPTMFVGMLVGAIGEEIGWRCFLQPSLEAKYNIVLATVLVGLFWGLWHIGHYKNGPLFMLGFLFFTVSASIVLRWLILGIEYNLAVAVAFHLVINICFLVFFKNAHTDTHLMLWLGGVWLLPAALLMFLKGKNLR